MKSALTITNIHCIFFVFMIFSSSLINFAFAQNDIIPEDDFVKRVDLLDNLLSAQVPANLAGLSLAGAAFLVRLFNDQEEIKKYTIRARRDFIKAFGMFLVCTIAIFSFDSIEIIGNEPNIYVLLLDIITTYAFFGVGLMYLIKSAKELYLMYGK